MKKICGIYKITSPSGKVYIGQSTDINHRWNAHKSYYLKRKTKLYSSFISYGIENHKFEIICQCKPEELDKLEKYYIDLYQSFDGEHGLNLKDGGDQPRLSKECINSIANNLSEQYKEGKLTAWHKGKTGVYSEETLAKMSEAKKGKKRLPFTDETRMLISSGNKGKKKSSAHISKMNLFKKGHIPANTGIPHSEETREKIRLKRAMQIITPEQRKKQSDSLKQYFERVKQEKLTMIF